MNRLNIAKLWIHEWIDHLSKKKKKRGVRINHFSSFLNTRQWPEGIESF